MAFIKVLVCLISISFFASVESSTTPKECNAEWYIPWWLSITDCDNQPCKWENGSTVFIFVGFFSPEYTKTLTPKISTTNQNGVTTPYPLPNDNGCELLLDGSCPVFERQFVLLEFNATLNYTPGTNFTLELKVLSETESVLMCFLADITIIEKK